MLKRVSRSETFSSRFTTFAAATVGGCWLYGMCSLERIRSADGFYRDYSDPSFGSALRTLYRFKEQVGADDISIAWEEMNALNKVQY